GEPTARSIDLFGLAFGHLIGADGGPRVDAAKAMSGTAVDAIRIARDGEGAGIGARRAATCCRSRSTPIAPPAPVAYPDSLRAPHGHVRHAQPRRGTMTDRVPIEETNLDRYGDPVIPWSRPRDPLAASTPKADTPFFLGTARPDGRPHAAGIGALWLD